MAKSKDIFVSISQKCVDSRVKSHFLVCGGDRTGLKILKVSVSSFENGFGNLFAE